MMQRMIMSQLSLTKISMKMLTVSFEKHTDPAAKVVLKFLEPFNDQLKTKNLKVEVIQGNEIPDWAYTDWKIFSDILFHLVQNAIKFNVENGRIQIVLSFHTFEGEFGT